MIRTVPLNAQGRDFLVGDLHGCFTPLMHSLDRIKFDFTKDRLFSTGDLVDRGPESLDCLRLLKEPWFNACLGNHDEMLIQSIAEGLYTRAVVRNAHSVGAEWVYTLPLSEEEELTQTLFPLLLDMPLVLRVQHPHLHFKVIHAEAVVNDRVLGDDELERPSHVYQHPLLWGRTLTNSLQDSLAPLLKAEHFDYSGQAWAPSLGLTYVGHEIVKRPTLHKSHMYIDCGAVTRQHSGGGMALLSHDEIVRNLTDVGLLR